MRVSAYIISALVAALLPILAIQLEDGFELRRLSDDTFQPSTSKGLWLVEHFSPRCHHCKQFAPTWEKLARANAHLERLTGFHLAQVDCLAQGDLCNSNGIKFYPQIMLYKDGQLVEQYNEDRSYESLSGYIEDQAIPYARGEPISAGTERSADGDGDNDREHDAGQMAALELLRPSPKRPNPDGKVIEADEAKLEEIKKAGPAFVEFFAPWCGHCKKLRPTYEQLAAAFRNKLNIVAVDCVANAILCKKEGIMSYPTLRKLENGEKTEYTGARSLDALKAAASTLVKSSGLPMIQYEDFNATVFSEEAFFLYLTNFDTAESEKAQATAALEKVSSVIPSYTSADPLLYRNLSIANPPPTSLLLAFSSQSPKAIASLPFPSSASALEKFINMHRYPTLQPLTPANYAEIMKSDLDPIVVLGVLHTTAKDQRVRLEKVARAWKRGGRDMERPVWFVWVDGQKWGGWMRRAYGIKKARLPTAVIVSPSTGEYYDHSLEGERIELEGASIFSALEGVFQKHLKPRKTHAALKWGNSPFILTPTGLLYFSSEHPIIAIIIALAIAGAVLYRLSTRRRDTRGALPGPYGNPYAEKYSPSGNRLD